MTAISSAPSNRPSAHFRQHHDVDSPAVDQRRFFRTHWSVRSQVQKLFETEAISLPEWQAALRLRRLVERAFGAQLRCCDLYRPFGATRTVDRTAGLDHKLGVIAALRNIEQALGPATYDLLVLAVVEDQCAAELGRRLGCDRKTARGRVIRALQALAAV